MVVICLPTAALTGNMQERTGAPSRCTVQEPHCATPQPYLVPVRPTCSRIAHNSGVAGSTSTSRVLPLIVRRAIEFPPCDRCVAYGLHRRRPRGRRVCRFIPVNCEEYTVPRSEVQRSERLTLQQVIASRHIHPRSIFFV